jgi:hypothetical protein
VRAVGRGFVAVLASDQRGPMVTRKAETREAAFAVARRLLDEAEDRTWFNGDLVRVEVGQSAR